MSNLKETRKVQKHGDATTMMICITKFLKALNITYKEDVEVELVGNHIEIRKCKNERY